MATETTAITSATGIAHGWGRARYKWVSGLTTTERAAVREGRTVLVRNCPPSGGGNGTGTTVRRVIYQPGRGYTHRMP